MVAAPENQAKAASPQQEEVKPVTVSFLGAEVVTPAGFIAPGKFSRSWVVKSLLTGYIDRRLYQVSTVAPRRSHPRARGAGRPAVRRRSSCSREGPSGDPDLADEPEPPHRRHLKPSPKNERR